MRKLSPQGGVCNPRPEKRVLPGLILAVMGIVTVEFMMIGLLPGLSVAFGVSLERSGVLISAFALSAAIAGPTLTFALAPFSARTVLPPGLVIFAGANFVVVMLPQFEAAATARVIQGALLTPLVSIGSASAAAMARRGSGDRAIVQVNFGTVLGSVFAVPAALAGAAYLGWQGIYCITALIILLSALLLRIALPRDVTPGTASLIGQAHILTKPLFVGHLAASALLFTGMFSAYSYITPYLSEVAGLGGVSLTATLGAFGVAGLFGNWIAARLVGRDVLRLTVGVGLVLTGAIASLASELTHILVLVVVILLWGAAHVAAFVICQVRVMRAGRDAPAFAGALNIAVANLGIAVGAAFGGLVSEHAGLAAIGVAGAGLCAAAAGVAWMVRVCESRDRALIPEA